MRALITGGTGGLGAAVARQLAAQGWAVMIVGRGQEQGARLAADIGGTFLQADLSLLSDTCRLARQVEEPLDALVLCAGALFSGPSPKLTREGLEATFALNYLSRFALSQLLVSKLAPEGCVLMVSGNGKYKRASTDWSAHDAGFKAAFKAALAVDMYASELSRRSPGLRVHTCYPGMVRTNLLKEAALPMRLVFSLFGAPVERGGAYLTRLIVEPHAQTHWNQERQRQFSPALPSGQATAELWEYSVRMLSPYLDISNHQRRHVYAL